MDIQPLVPSLGLDFSPELFDVLHPQCPAHTLEETAWPRVLCQYPLSLQFLCHL